MFLMVRNFFNSIALRDIRNEKWSKLHLNLLQSELATSLVACNSISNFKSVLSLMGEIEYCIFPEATPLRYLSTILI